MSDEASARKAIFSDTDSPSTSASVISGRTFGKTKIFKSDTHVVNVLEKLRANTPCDITLIANDGIRLEAHRLILAASTDYFVPQPMQLKIDGATLKLILDYMYSGKIELNSGNVRGVLCAANCFQIEELIPECYTFAREAHQCLETQRDKLIFITYSTSTHFKVFSYSSGTDVMASQIKCKSPRLGIFGYSLILANNKLFKAGGKYYNSTINSDYFECMDFSTMEWSVLPRMLASIQNPLMAETGGNVYASSHYNWCFYKFDFSQNEWQRKRSLAYTPYELLGYYGLVYAACDDLYDLQVYDPGTNEWSSTAPRNNDIKGFRMAGLNGYVYAIGGNEVNSEKCSRKVERYNPTTNIWTEMKSLSTHLLDLNCCAWNGRIIACGTSNDVAYAEEYNPETDEWNEFPPLSKMSFKHFVYLSATSK